MNFSPSHRTAIEPPPSSLFQECRATLRAPFRFAIEPLRWNAVADGNCRKIVSMRMRAWAVAGAVVGIVLGLTGAPGPGFAADPVWRHASALTGEPRYPKASRTSTTSTPTRRRVAASASAPTAVSTAPTSSCPRAIRPRRLAGLRDADDRQPGRARRLRRLRPARRGAAVPRRLFLGDLPPRSRCEMAGRHARHRRRRDLVLHHAEGDQPAARLLLQPCGEGRTAGEREIKFTFDAPGNRELPHIMGQLYVLPKHWWEGTDAVGKKRDIRATTLEPPMGSGPYKVKEIIPGRSVVMERDPTGGAPRSPSASGRTTSTRSPTSPSWTRP